MSDPFCRKTYKAHAAIVSKLGVVIPKTLEEIYKKYIRKEMANMPYIDAAIVKMYTLVFFLKYIKEIKGEIKLKDAYAKLDIQKKLISRAMSRINIKFDKKEKVKTYLPTLEDWSTLYSITKGIGADIAQIKVEKKKSNIS